MTQRSTARRTSAVVAVLVCVLVCVLVGVLVGATLSATLPFRPPLGTAAVSQPAVQLVASRIEVDGVDTDAVVAAAGTDHVAVMPGATADRVGLLAQVNRARAANIGLTVVVLPDELSGTDATQVAQALMRQLNGTVLVVTPTSQGAASDSVADSLLSDGLTAAAGGGSAVIVTTGFVDALTAEPFPWALIVLVATLIAVVVLVGGVLWAKRRRQNAS